MSLLLASLQAAPAIGQPAPPISLQSWLNVAKNEDPSLASLKGKVIMLEFWGTWCHPCVQAMPHVQELHDRYQDRGLKVLAISYEDESVLTPFLTKNAYRMAVGSDPTKKVVSAYGVRGWPATYLIDRTGVLVFAGTPYDVEPAIEKALGLESNPASLLTAVMSAMAAGNNADLESAINRLIEKDASEFDLAAWAKTAGGSATSSAKQVVPDEALDQCAKQWGSKDAAARQAALDALVGAATKSFDLSAWVKKLHDAQFPLTLSEFKALLERESFAAAIDALIARKPGGDVLATAAKDKRLKSYSAKKAEEARSFAKKGVMIERWVLNNVEPKDNDKFWDELNVNGVQMSPDKKSIAGVLVGGKPVTKANAPAFIHQQLARAYVMEALASGKPPKLNALDAAVRSERDQLVKTLEAKYGTTGAKR